MSKAGLRERIELQRKLIATMQFHLKLIIDSNQLEEPLLTSTRNIVLMAGELVDCTSAGFPYPPEPRD